MVTLLLGGHVAMSGDLSGFLQLKRFAIGILASSKQGCSSASYNAQGALLQRTMRSAAENIAQGARLCHTSRDPLFNIQYASQKLHGPKC